MATIKDGISQLSDKEIIQKANDTPKKLKESLRKLSKKCEKYNITLDRNGEVCYV